MKKPKLTQASTNGNGHKRLTNSMIQGLSAKILARNEILAQANDAIVLAYKEIEGFLRTCATELGVDPMNFNYDAKTQTVSEIKKVETPSG